MLANVTKCRHYKGYDRLTLMAMSYKISIKITIINKNCIHGRKNNKIA